MRRFAVSFLSRAGLGLLLGAASVSAATRTFSVDAGKLMAAYRDGEFDAVAAMAGPILKPGMRCERADSLTALKFLGVVYAAHPDTRELGRYCFFKLLDATPEADLLELFVGEEVGVLFDTVRREHALARARALTDAEAVAPAVLSGGSSPASALSVPGGAQSREATRSMGAEPAGGADALPIDSTKAPFWRPYVWPAAVAVVAVGFLMLNRDGETASDRPTTAALTRP